MTFKSGIDAACKSYSLEGPHFVNDLGPSPRDWRTLIHFNVVLTVFHIDYISQGVCKSVRTKFQCIVVLQLSGDAGKLWETKGSVNQSMN